MTFDQDNNQQLRKCWPARRAAKETFCGEWKPLSEFRVRADNGNPSHQCEKCRIIDRRIHDKKYADKLKEQYIIYVSDPHTQFCYETIKDAEFLDSHALNNLRPLLSKRNVEEGHRRTEEEIHYIKQSIKDFLERNL